MKYMKFLVIGLIAIAHNGSAVTVINQLPSGNVLTTKKGHTFNPGESIQVGKGAKISLIVDGKPSATDYIEFETLKPGGDKKSGRLMSACSAVTNSRNDETSLDACAIKFADQQ